MPVLHDFQHRVVCSVADIWLWLQWCYVSCSHSLVFIVCQGALKKSDIWTQSRQSLEEAIEEEKENTEHNWDSDLLSHEQRLDQRLDKLKLDMFIMGSDGACQV